MSSPIVVQARGLSFGYGRTATPVLDRLDADFRHGAVTVLAGASGSGKSTLLYLLALLMRPRAGSIEWHGQRVDQRADGIRSALRATHAGFVFQDAMLDPSKSVLENACEQGLFYGMRSRDAKGRAHALLERLGVHDRVDHKPGEISGGQAQRVALCRALLVEPSVIFADEPTGNLDSVAAQAVYDALRERADAGTCVIIATHSPELVEKADSCLWL